jgi:hypothetical protein
MQIGHQGGHGEDVFVARVQAEASLAQGIGQGQLVLGHERRDGFTHLGGGELGHITVVQVAVPANCAAAASGTLLREIALPSDWMAAASSGSKAKTGTWEDASADATGTAAHFRLYATDGTTCHAQGTVTATGGGGDMTVDNTSFAAAQAFSVTSFTLTDGNA